MATRSTIAVVHNDGSVSQVYCHWDGGLWYNAQVLVKFYNTAEKVEELLSYGDASSLGATVGESHDFNARADYNDENIASQCTFYGRDRGEKGTEARVYSDIAEYESKGDAGQFEEFNYLFIEGEWYYKSYDGLVRNVAEKLAEDSAVEETV